MIDGGSLRQFYLTKDVFIGLSGKAADPGASTFFVLLM
jgi:hypothetical protein